MVDKHGFIAKLTSYLYDNSIILTICEPKKKNPDLIEKISERGISVFISVIIHE